MNQIKWDSLTPSQRDTQRDNSDLSPQLVGYEGWRVEVVSGGVTKRFNVGKSTGWKPCHLEIHNKRAMGGWLAEKRYDSVKPLYKVK